MKKKLELKTKPLFRFENGQQGLFDITHPTTVTIATIGTAGIGEILLTVLMQAPEAPTVE